MLTTIIIAKNEEQFLQNCLNSVKNISSQIIVVDNGSTDRTVTIAQSNNCTIIISQEPSFALRREIGLQKALHPWVLYIDADERLTPELENEIKYIINSKENKITNYIINRKDYYFGSEWPAFSPVHRLFLREHLLGWQGIVHESPRVNGQTGHLQNYLIHLTHTDLNSMLRSTLRWSDYEAKLRFDAQHPPIIWWRLIRVILTGWWNSFYVQKGYQKGTLGWVESLYQGFSLFITYAKLWELQNQEQIRKAYEKLEQPFQQSK
jgi:glycosyltransferase involved in cell wall biosynthesis